MPEIIQDICQLTFATTVDRDRVIRVPDPTPDISVSKLHDSADYMINAAVFDEYAGNLTGLKRADILRIITRPLIA